MTEQSQAPGEAPKHLNVRQAAFIGVGAMVGAGIFAPLAILALGTALDFGWKRTRANRARPIAAGL